MKIRNASQFTDQIGKNLAYRKRELTNLLNTVDKSKKPHIEPVSKAAVCLLYGHWEGFVKFGGTCFANFVHFNGVPVSTLSNGFIAACVQQKLKQVRNSKKLSLGRELVELTRHPNVSLGPLPWDSVVQTHDNLNLESLREILEFVGCDTSFYETKKGIIDEQLVHYRNSIAHTGFSDFDSKDYPALHAKTLELIERFRDDLEDAISNRTYLSKGTC
jgi:hypothetical protein